MARRKEKHDHARTASAGKSGGRAMGWGVGIIAALLGFVLYVNTLGHQYTLDDYSTIKSNWIVKSGLNAESVKLILTTEYRYGAWNSPGALYRPIPLLMFALEWQLSPDDPRLGHLINVLLYAFTGWLLWVTLRRVLAGQPPALVAAAVLLFMAHPVHTEVVANIKSRDEILSLLFGVGALYALWRYLDNNGTKWLVGAVALYTLALFSKESAITLLAIFPLTIWFFRDEPWSRTLRVSLLMLTPAVIYLLIRKSILDAQPYQEVYSALDTVYMATKDPAEQLATALMMCGRYLRTLVLPHPLLSEIGYPEVRPVGFGDWRSLTGLALYAGMFIVALRGLRNKNILSYAILFYLITFSLFSNVFMIIGTSYGERLLYLPSLGFALMTAVGVAALFRVDDRRSLWDPNGKRTLFWGTCALVLVLYGVRTVTRNPAWYTSGTLYAADLPHAPNSAKLNYHNGIEVIKKGMVEETGVVTDTAWVMKAIASHDRAIELFPKYADAYNARGTAWLRLGKYDRAEQDLRTSLGMRRNNAEALSNLGFIQFNRGQLAEAESLFREALKHDPRQIDARRNLGAVLAVNKRFAEAIEQWKEGLRYDAENPTLLFFIGSAYRDMGRNDVAQGWLQRSERAKRKAG